MSAEHATDALAFGPWRALRRSGELIGAHGSERLEPKVMELLLLLAAEPGRVWSRDDIMQRLWPGLVVGEDTLARVVFKLRKSLGDAAKAPLYIETIPKRGYRWIYRDAAEAPADAAPSPPRPEATRTARPRRRRLLGHWALTALAIALGALAFSGAPRKPVVPADSEAQTLTDRANDFYFQYTRVDNEAAIELFERVIALRPGHAPAYAGLANALAQREMRWPASPSGAPLEFRRLGDALKHGHTRTPSAQRRLLRATQLAEHALALAPEDAGAHKALGLVRSVREDFAGALQAYRRAVELDPDAWGPLINIGDILQIGGEPEQATPYFEAAFAAMTRVYSRQSARIRPWYAETALLIGDSHDAQQRHETAERWYRQALEIAPFHVEATRKLAVLLRARNRAQEAAALCADLGRRAGQTAACEV
jgi:DNA-binding winged helix-turn-helix (wHTH) protein/Flp pilus assembly protein TadD